jgi:hypothetical protein
MTIIVFIILGVIVVIVLLILYLVLAGKPQTPAATNAKLKSSLHSLPEPHVLRVPIEWPPRHPPQIKMGYDNLQGWDPLHTA